jgi:hypothetical protein
MSFQSYSGKQIVEGLDWEIMTRLHKRGAASGKVPRYIYFSKGNYFNYRHHLMGPRVINGDTVKILAFEMCEEASVEVLLFSQAVDIIKDGDTVKGVIIQNKSGFRAVTANLIVDTSADADIAYYAGVDSDKVKEYVTSNLDKFAIIWRNKI